MAPDLGPSVRMTQYKNLSDLISIWLQPGDQIAHANLETV